MDDHWGYPYDLGNLHMCVAFFGGADIRECNDREVYRYVWFTGYVSHR